MSYETVTLATPFLSLLPGRKLHLAMRRVAQIASALDHTTLYGIADSVIARDVGCCKKTVQRARELAVEAGFVEVTQVGSGRTKHRYRFLLGVSTDPGPEGGHQKGPTDLVHEPPPVPAPKRARSWAQDMDSAIDDVQALRPDWGRGGIARALILAVRRGVSFTRALAALLAAAADESTRTPARAVGDGWWWDESDPRRARPRKNARKVTTRAHGVTDLVEAAVPKHVAPQPEELTGPATPPPGGRWPRPSDFGFKPTSSTKKRRRR